MDKYGFQREQAGAFEAFSFSLLLYIELLATHPKVCLCLEKFPPRYPDDASRCKQGDVMHHLVEGFNAFKDVRTSLLCS